ncbi:vacuolar protein sorting-associated protein 53 homolog [Phlebotomus argentipes]|uniref:vacuolar protein sorting-associated protein 53 homolog n=1 Tax=Phlebotomus argentipes TaxID=94469 RepID=UPI0028930EFE|nr:vacuolar protein sorting-associated protein 53 homolog [Phlebotomus argentipes]
MLGGQDDFDGGQGENRIATIVLTSDVQAAIDQVLQNPGASPLDQPDFNPTDYINQLFPNEQSLSNIDDVIAKMECEVSVIDDNIRSVVRGQTNTGQDGKKALEDAQRTIMQLSGQITEIKTRAEKTEDMVKEITRDIKQLDSAKKNLTSAITTLNHLHMLVGGVESLTKLAEKRLYGEVLNPLQAITEVNLHFQQYTEVAHIKTLSDKVSQIHAELATQITEDFKNVFTPGQQNVVKMSLSQLADACKVVSVLEPKVKRELLKWFINLQLQEYVQLFHENQDIAWLDKIDKRYAWIKRHLLDFEDKFGKIFPLDWEVSERITVQFCHTTHEQLSKLMARRRVEMDVKLLLYAIGKTTAFEALLAKRFTGVTLQDAPGKSPPTPVKPLPVQEVKSAAESPAQSETEEGVVKAVASPFSDLIGSCFKPYLDIYTDSIDKNLAELIEQFVQAKAPLDPVSRTTVLPSCADLFVFYKKCMVQCVQLSNGKPMYDLAMVFKKYLREYAAKILESRIPKLTASYTPSSISTSMSLLTRDLQNLSTAAGQVIHSFLKEGEAPRFTREEITTICCILTTAEYCLETVQQLEDKLREKVDATYSEKIDLGEEKDVYHRIISNCIQLLVQDLETGCEPALIVMSKIQWQTISNVGDQSSFVNSIIGHFKLTIPTIRDNLATSRKYYIQFCHKFVNSFIPKYINHLYKCRLTSVQESNVLGCEQLLLDTHSLKTVLLDLPSIGSQVNRKAPASFTKIVIKGMTKAEMIIKVVMAPVIPASVFTEQFLKLLPDSTLVEFHKILDMKGMRRVDQAQLAELFKRTAPKENLSLALDAVSASSVAAKLLDSPEGDKGRIKKLEKLIKKRLPN